MNHQQQQPPGVILQGSRTPTSKRINQWCAHYGRTLVAHQCNSRTAAITVARRLYASTTAAQRSAMLVQDKERDDEELLLKAAGVVDARGNGRLARSMERFAKRRGVTRG